MSAGSFKLNPVQRQQHKSREWGRGKKPREICVVAQTANQVYIKMIPGLS